MYRGWAEYWQNSHQHLQSTQTYVINNTTTIQDIDLSSISCWQFGTMWHTNFHSKLLLKTSRHKSKFRTFPGFLRRRLGSVNKWHHAPAYHPYISTYLHSCILHRIEEVETWHEMMIIIFWHKSRSLFSIVHSVCRYVMCVCAAVLYRVTHAFSCHREMATVTSKITNI